MDALVDRLEAQAAALLPSPVYQYFRQGAATGISADEALRAWRRYRFAPRVLRDVSEVSLESSILGAAVASPIAIAPSSLQRHAHPDGEIEMGRGAAAAGALMCVSSNAGQPFAAIGAVSGPWWVQAYVLRERSLTTGMLQRAVDGGASAVVLTADTPVVGSKSESSPSVWDVTPDDFLHANEELSGVSHRDVEKALDLTADSVGWLAEVTGLPVVVKGVLRADDAARVVAAGAAAVWVSNHGGRQLDRSIASAEALPGVVSAVDGRAEIYVDGGVRDGRDALTALALGANAVFIGRPALWALTVGGAEGVADLLGSLNDDLSEAMSLCGGRSLADLSRDLVLPCSPS